VANVTFIYPCISDQATLASGGAPWQMPLAAMQDRRLSKVARSASASLADASFNVDLGRLRTIGGVTLVRNNLSLVGRWRVRVANTADMADPLYDSGWIEGWGRVYPFGTLPWGSPNWWNGKMTEEERATYPGLMLALLPMPVVGRYLRVEVDDTTNPAGYIEFGRLFVGEVWTPEYNASSGASVIWNTATTTDTAIDGTEYPDRREGLRSFSFSL
jgi:hypothetical protein